MEVCMVDRDKVRMLSSVRSDLPAAWVLIGVVISPTDGGEGLRLCSTRHTQTEGTPIGRLVYANHIWKK